MFAGVYEGASSNVVISDGHYELQGLLDNLSKSEKKMYFLGNDVARYWDLIESVLGDKVIKVEDENLNMPHASVFSKFSIRKDSCR